MNDNNNTGEIQKSARQIVSVSGNRRGYVSTFNGSPVRQGR